MVSNGQFSLGQYGFYAIGAYTAADITYRWTQLHSATGLMVVMMIALFAGLMIMVIRNVVTKIRGLDTLSAFALYLAAVLASIFVAVKLGQLIGDPITNVLNLLQENVAQRIVFLFAVFLGGVIAAEISFLYRPAGSNAGFGLLRYCHVRIYHHRKSIAGQFRYHAWF